MSGKISVTHIITGLPRGGAQTVLYGLLQRFDRERFEMNVISLGEKGVVGSRIEALGVQVRALELSRALPDPLRLLRLRRWLSDSSPTLVQTWLHHSDLVGGIAARLTGIPVLWNLRQTDLDQDTQRLSTAAVTWACHRLAGRLPVGIVCCCDTTRRVYEAHGYPANRLVVIDNGIDLERYRPSREAGALLRQQLRLDAAAQIVGMVARFHPMKDHRAFVTAAAAVLARIPSATFVLCGEGIDSANAELTAWIGATGAPERFHLLGMRDDLPALTAAFDVAVSASNSGEGFSNVLLEAMACGVACVATDVGDARNIVADTGWIVAKRQPLALAGAVIEALSDPEQLRARARAARQRAVDNYSVALNVSRYEALYEEVAATRTVRAAAGARAASRPGP